MKLRQFIASTLLCSIAITAQAGGQKKAVAEPAAGTSWTEPQTGIEFVWVPNGCFDMGTKMGDADGELNERPLHQVCLKGFWMSRYEITQKQYKLVMLKNPSKSGGENYPVNAVNWNDARKFANELSINLGLKFALPSESQWEYACRAGGTHAKYCGDGLVNSFAWTGEELSSGAPHPVGQKKPNAWGLYDMSGNVWEWVQDCFSENYQAAPADGSASEAGKCERRVLRGGNYWEGVRAATRGSRGADDEGLIGWGIRVIRLP